MSFWKDFSYVDTYFDHPKKRIKWIRIPERDVHRRIVGPSRGSNCFTSVQRFKDAVALRTIREQTAKLKAKGGKRTQTEQERYEELIRAGDDLPDMQSRYHGLFFDFDADATKLGLKTEEEALELARDQADRLATWFISQFDLNPAHVQCWFSGKKGFHVMVRPEPFGITPHPHLTLIAKEIAFELADFLKLDTLDRSVYSETRMWRIPNSTHPATGRFKIELEAQELASWSIEKIIAASISPRDLTSEGKRAHGMGNEYGNPGSFVWGREEYLNIAKDPDAHAWYMERFADYEAYRDLQNLRPRKPIIPLADIADGMYPVCVQDIMENGPKEGGPNRNRVTMPLVGFLYDAGIEKSAATDKIVEWTKEFYREPHLLQSRIANAKSVVERAYRGGVHFACQFIRSVGGTGDNGRVACVKEKNCPYIRDPIDQEPESIPMIHLSEASKGCYEGTKVRMAVHVATMARGPFILPKAGTIKCNPQDDAKICGNCPNNNSGGQGNLEWHIDAGDREVLSMINVPDNNKKGAIKAKCGIPPKCARHKIEVDENTNVEEVQVIPMVDFHHSYMVDADDEDVGKQSAKHVVRTAYHMGHGLEANKKYVIEPTVVAHPKDQVACFLFDKKEPAQNDIDQFKMTDELRRKLSIFKPKKGQSVEDKLIEIHRDFTVNVHQIGGRIDLSIAFDLCYHSVIAFTFLSQMVNKGYFELVVIGDSGTGKSTMIERMMTHFGLGELIAGEDSKRTGLVHSSTQMHGQWVLKWGKIPQNDRRLLVIDEFSGIPREEIGKLTQLRSSGKARGSGVNEAYETFARTRLICVTNPRDNDRPMANYTHGVTALQGIYPEHQDIRRVDFAVVADSEDVKSEIVNKRWDQVKMPHVYTADLCRNLILWAWSRDPRHVKWGEGAEDEVRAQAGSLGKTYYCDIPLAQESDLRLKIARLSCAVAARVFSTDKEAKNLYVEKEHVQFAARFMDRAYRKDSMSYFEYAKKYKQDNYISTERAKRVRQMLSSFGPDRDAIITALLEVDILTKPLFADLTSLENDDLKKIWKFMLNERLIVRTIRGYKRTKAFTKFLKKMGSKSAGYSGELASDFETGGLFEESTGNDQPTPPPAEQQPGMSDNDFFDEEFEEDDLEYDEPDF